MSGGEQRAGEGFHVIDGWRSLLLVVVMLSGPPLMALTFSTIAPVLPMIAAHFRGNSGGTMVAQWIMTMPAIGLMLGAPSGGWLIDRIGPRMMTIAAFAGFAIAGSAGLWLQSAGGLLLSRFIMGFAGASIATVATYLIGARYDETVRRRMIAAQDSIAGAAAMGAVLLSGILAQSDGWRAPFAIYLVALPLLVAAILGVPALHAGASRGAGQGQPLSGLLPFWAIYLIIAAMAGLMMMPATQVPFLLEAHGVEDPVIRSRVIACSALASIMAAASFPVVRGRLGEAGTFRIILAAYAAGTAVLSLSATAGLAALGCFLMGLGTGLFSPFFASLLIARIDVGLRGRAIGFMFGAIFLSEFASPLVVLPLRHAFGVNGGFAVLSCMIVAGLVATAIRAPFRQTASRILSNP